MSTGHTTGRCTSCRATGAQVVLSRWRRALADWNTDYPAFVDMSRHRRCGATTSYGHEPEWLQLRTLLLTIVERANVGKVSRG
jgi:hypothetical protein